MLIAVLVSVALAVLYRVAPDRDAPKIRWVSVGAVAATVLWLVASIGFSIYVANFGNYAKTYGAFAGIVVIAVLAVDHLLRGPAGCGDQRRGRAADRPDTTKRPGAPDGQRDAVKADSIPDENAGSEPKSDTGTEPSRAGVAGRRDQT